MFGSRAGYRNGTATPPTASTRVLKAQKSTCTKWSTPTPKFSKIVSINRCGSLRSYAELIRAWLPTPAIVTYRSRGNESTATREADGSTRKMMIVSLRSPMSSRLPKAAAYGELGSMHAPLSAPVTRKFLASGSAGGNVGGVVVALSAVGSRTVPSAGVVDCSVGAAAASAMGACAGLVMSTTSRCCRTR